MAAFLDPRRSRARPTSGERGERRLDVAGIGLAGAAGAWAAVAAHGRAGADAGPVAQLVIGAVVVALLARAVTAAGRTLVPAAVAFATTGAFVLGFPGLLHASGGPTGYANANATLAALAAVAAAAVMARHPRGTTRQAWAGLTALLVAAVVVIGSIAGGAMLAVSAVLALGSIARRDARLAVAGGVVVTSLLLGLTSAMAAGGDPLGVASRTDGRTELWDRALDHLREEPLRGIGPDEYGGPFPVTMDADLRWAHHGYLQQGAEQGVVGLGLLLLLVAWGYARLWVAGHRAPADAVAGATALTIVAGHAAVDHVLHHPAVTLTLVALVAWATAPGPRPAPGSPGSPRRPR